MSDFPVRDRGKAVSPRRNFRRWFGYLRVRSRNVRSWLSGNQARRVLPLLFAILLLRHLALVFFASPDVSSAFSNQTQIAAARIARSRLSPPLLPREVLARYRSIEVHDVMPSPKPLETESLAHRPDPSLYGTGDERCFVVGDSNAQRRFKNEPIWQVNSRALCYEAGPVCLSGPVLDRVTVFSPRGSNRCDVLSVENNRSRPASVEEMEGSCASFRSRRVFGMYGRGNGKELFSPSIKSFTDAAGAAGESVKWYSGDLRAETTDYHSHLAIIVPKYDWSWNICHYNRIWQNIIYTIRHLHRYIGNRDASKVRSIAVLFRAKHAYKDHWTTGMRDATLAAVAKETGIDVTVGKLRYDGVSFHHCLKRAILLGAEGRVDAYPFLNDTATWTKESQLNDDHIPQIPHDALWLRSTLYARFGLAEAGETNKDGFYTHIPVPPLVVGHLVRSVRSRRRFVDDSAPWFSDMLRKLADSHGFELREIRCNATLQLSKQVGALRSVGLGVGIHGANLVNTMFMPAGGALFEVFPYRYVRYYYSAGANSGLRYSFHEVSSGPTYSCHSSLACMFKYREAAMTLVDDDRFVIPLRISRAMSYIRRLHEQYPSGRIPLVRIGNNYAFADSL